MKDLEGNLPVQAQLESLDLFTTPLDNLCNLQTLPNLTTLRLLDVPMYIEFLGLLSDYFRDTSALRFLHVENLGVVVSNPELVSLIRSIICCKTLETFHLSQGAIWTDSTVILALAELILETESIMQIHVKSQSSIVLEEEVQRVLLRSIRDSVSIVDCRITFKGLGGLEPDDLRDCLQQNIILNTLEMTSVYFSSNQIDQDWAGFMNEIRKESFIENINLGRRWNVLNEYEKAKNRLQKDSLAVLRRLQSFLLVKNSRLISSMRCKSGITARLPAELIHHILIKTALNEELWPEGWLPVINRRLLDRQTLGKISHECIPFSQSSLYILCRNMS